MFCAIFNFQTRSRAVKEEFDNEMREIKQHEEKMQEEISKVNHHSGPCIPGAKKNFCNSRRKYISV